MERHIYTTCGTSLLKSNCWGDKGEEKGISNVEAASEAKTTEDKLKRENRCRKFIENVRVKPHGSEELAGRFDLNTWNTLDKLRRLPAELASLRVIQNYCVKADDQLGPLNSHDKLTLVRADNSDAEFCADVIQKILTEKRLLGDVIVEPLWKLNGLDPSNTVNFQSALDNLWQGLFTRMPFSEDPERRYYLNLTGGYKAIVMLFACFSCKMGKNHSRIFYRNEEAAGTEVLTMVFGHDKYLVDAFEVNRIDAEGEIRGTIGPHDF